MPVTFTVWSLLAALSRTFSGSMNPAYFHIANVLVHAVNSALVYLILCRLSHRQGALTTKQRGAALCGALFFALHPLVVEPVAWAMGMKDLAAATLSLAAMWRYLLFLPEGRRSLYWQAVVCMLGALLCKPSAALIPATLFILEIYWEQLPWHRALKRLLPWCGVGVIALVLTKYLQPDGELPFSTQWTDRPLIAADAVAFYLQKLCWPAHMSMDFGRRPDRVLALGWQLKTLVTLALFGLALIFTRGRSGREFRTAAALFILPLLPVLGFSPFGYQGFSTVGARYAYMSLLGPALLIKSWVVHLRHRLALPICAFLITMTLGPRSYCESQYWRSYPILFGRAVELDPDNWTMRYRFGWALSHDLQLEAAIREYTAAISQNERVAPIHRDLGLALAGLNRWPEAESSLRQALGLNPDLLDARKALADTLHAHALQLVRRSSDAAQLTIALPLFEEALTLAPDDAAIRANLDRARALLKP